MFTRFIMQLFGKNYEPCKTCEALREQLVYERAQNKEMLETLTSLLKPVPIVTAQTTEPRPITAQGKTWTKRRTELEKADRERARIEKTSPVVAKPDSEITETKPAADDGTKPISPSKTVEQLEMELGVVETETTH